MQVSIEILGALIAPAALISAAALLLLSTSSRVGRVNDRLQRLIATIEQSQSRPISASREQRRFPDGDQLVLLQQRMTLLRSAIGAQYVTIALLVVASIANGLLVLVPSLTTIRSGGLRVSSGSPF
jgi:hypothetical protein